MAVALACYSSDLAARAKRWRRWRLPASWACNYCGSTCRGVVSKYIGDTEKNIDRVFNDAQQSGSAILIDEADALLGNAAK